MRSHVKNILAGVGTGAVVITLGVLSIMSFASIGGGVKVPGTITIIKDVVPDSKPNYTPHEDIDFRFEVDGPGSGFGFTLDDDGDTANLHSNTATYSIEIPEIGNRPYTITETQPTNVFKYNTEWVCYPNGGYPNKYLSKGFGKVGEVTIDTDNPNVTCLFTNTLTDATLTVVKNIVPPSSDKVDFDIFTPNDNEHANGYDYYSIGNGESHTTQIATRDANNNKVSYTISEFLGIRGSQNPEFTSKYQVSYECKDAAGNVIKSGNLSTIDDLTFDTGDNITCTFTNTKNPEFIVRKVVDPSPQNNTEGFAFRITQQLGQFTKSADFNLSHGESNTFYPKFDWQQTISELLSSDQLNKYWTSYSCLRFDNQGNQIGGPDESAYGYHKPSYSVSLVKGEKADCTFTNHLFEMTIKKVVLDKDGNEINTDANSFEFKTNLGNNFFLIGNGDPKKAEKSFNFTLNGGIKFEELLTHDQSFLYDTSYRCTDRDGNQIASGNDGKISITTGLTNDSTGIICTVTNKQTPDAQVFVHKIFSPEDSDDIARVRVQPFGKPTLGEDKEIIHDHNQAWDVRPGDITIHEFQIIQNSNNPLKVYTQSYVCNFLAPSTRGPITSNSSEINIPGLKGGDRVQCTLTNKEVDAVVKIKKNVVGSNGTDLTDDTGVFNFVSTLPSPDNAFKLDDNATLPDPSEKVFSLKPNTDYDFYEVNIPNGYTASFVCVDDNKPNDPPLLTGTDRIEGLNLDKNQSATCTFTNTKAVARIVIVKDVVGKNDDTNVFKITNNTGVGDFFLDDNANQAPDSSKEITVPAGGTYNFTEELTTQQSSDYVTSWKCTDVNNSGGAGATFTAPILGTNESITCTFINTLISTQIIVRKDVKDEDGKDITNDPEVFSIENTTDNSDFYLDDNQADQQYSSEMILNVTPGKNYSLFEDLSTKQEENYTPSWECKLGNNVIKSSSGASISNIQAQKGQTVICVITNTKKIFRQNLTLIKVTKAPTQNQTFAFSAASLSNQVIKLITDATGTASRQFKVKAGNTLNITELKTNSKFHITSYTCKYIPSDPNHKTFSGNGNIIPTFTIPKGYDMECTFTNCTSGLICPLIGYPHTPDPTSGGGNVRGGGGSQ